MKSRSFIKNFWKSIIVVGCILYLSFASPSTFTGIPTFDNEDKLVHILMYLGFSFILTFEFNYATKKTKANSLIFISVCLVFPVLLGGLVEILQPMYFAPRTASWLDWLADTIGVLIGWGLMTLLKRTAIFNRNNKTTVN